MVLPVPPVAVVYQRSECPATGVAVKGTAVLPWQYVTGDVAVGNGGSGLMVIVKVPVTLQPFNNPVTVIVAVIGDEVLFVAVKAGMFPDPDAARPIEVWVLVQVMVVPTGLAVNGIAAILSPAQRVMFAGIFSCGMGFTVIGSESVVVPHSFVAEREMVYVPGVLKEIVPGLAEFELVGVPPGKLHK